MTVNKIKIGIIGGSGLDDPKILSDFHALEVDTPYGKPSSLLTTGQISWPARHATRSVADVVILSRHGKNHSIMPTNVPFRANIWALKEIGCTHILATTACGSLREEIKPKQLVFLDQFIDFTKLRVLSFYDDFKEKIAHTPMADPFSEELRQKLIETAEELKLEYHKRGTVITVEGPRFSTRAESFMYQKLGADVVNMSTLPEVSLANELGIPYASIAMSTDYDCWKEGEEPVTFEMVLENMKHNAVNVKKLLLAVVPKI